MTDARMREVKRLHDAGYDLIPLDGKRPIKANWTRAPRTPITELEHQLEPGRNIGVRLGKLLPDGRFIACLDVDIVGELTDAEKREVQVLLEGVGAQAPVAVSGFGNESRHVYVATPQPAKTRVLGRAVRKVAYSKAGKQKTGPVWTVELRGLGAQTVLPPSIHPDTQRVYQWKKKLNGAASLPTLPVAPALQIPTISTPQAAPSHRVAHVEALPIAPVYRQLLADGDCSNYESRSEALYAVLTVLVRDTQLDDKAIEQIIRNSKLSGKASERATGWVAGQAAKLRAKGTGVLKVLNELAEQVQTQRSGTGKNSELIPFDQLKPVLGIAAKASMSTAQMEEFLNAAKAKSGIAKKALKEELDATRTTKGGGAAYLAQGDPVYADLCARHGLVSWGGKSVVVRRRNNPLPWESSYEIVKLPDLAVFYENKPIVLGGKPVNPAQIWRTDPARKEYLEGVRLVPSDDVCPEGVFNLWQGYPYESVQGDVGMWREFVRDIICSGNVSYQSWLEDWIADMFQHPSHPTGVAIVMRGGEGVGKGTFANALGALLGSHYRHITQEAQLTGRFNAHFEDSMLIFADEMIWGGDKRSRGTLYALVTEKHLMVERKGFDAMPMRNLNRMVIASNNDWVVPAGPDARRWFVLDVSDGRKGQSVYFSQLATWLREGGYEALMHYYTHRPIRSDLRKAPITAALVEQKMAGLDIGSQWWASVLERGSVKEPLGDSVPQWEEMVSAEILRLSHQAYCRDYGLKPQYFPRLMRDLHKMVPWLKTLKDSGRSDRLELGPLTRCREHFGQLLGVE